MAQPRAEEAMTERVNEKASEINGIAGLAKEGAGPLYQEHRKKEAGKHSVSHIALEETQSRTMPVATSCAADAIMAQNTGNVQDIFEQARERLADDDRLPEAAPSQSASFDLVRDPCGIREEPRSTRSDIGGLQQDGELISRTKTSPLASFGVGDYWHDSSVETQCPRCKGDPSNLEDHQLVGGGASSSVTGKISGPDEHAHKSFLHPTSRSFEGMGCACSRHAKEENGIPEYEDGEGESVLNVRNSGGSVAAGAVMARGPRSVAPHPGLVLDSTGGNVGSVRSGTACKVEAALLQIELEICGSGHCSSAGTRHETSRASLRSRRKKITPSKIKEIKRRVALLVSEMPTMDHHQQGSPILPKQMEAAVDRACMGDLGALRSLLTPDATSRWPPNRATAPETTAPGYDDDSEAGVCDGLDNDFHTAAAAAAVAELASQIVPTRAFRASAARVAPAEERREEPAHRQHEVWKAPATTLTTIAEDSKDHSDVDSCETTRAVKREISPMEIYKDNYDSQLFTKRSSQTSSQLRMPPRLSAPGVGTKPSARILREEGPAAARRDVPRRGAHSEGNDDPGSVSSAVALAPALGSGDSQACQGKSVAPEGKGEMSNEKKSRRASKTSGSYASRDHGSLKMPEPSSAPLPYRSSRYPPVRSSPNDDPPRVPPILQTQPLPSQQQQQKLHPLNHSPITCKSPASSTVDPKDDWTQLQFEDVHVQPAAAPESPHIEQSSGSSASPYSSDSPPPTVARPEAVLHRDHLGAKASPSTVEEDPPSGAATSVDESWKKALLWRSRAPAPSTVLKRSALPQLRARSRPSVQPVPTTVAMPTETSREMLPPTSPPGQKIVKSSAGATSALGVKPGGLVRPSSRTAALAEPTISTNGDDSELCLPAQTGEETEAPSTAEGVGMPEKSSSLLVASKVSASPEMAPETPRVDPSTSSTASNFAAPVAPETSVPFDSAIIESPPYTSRSLHSVSSTSVRGGKAGVNSLGTLPASGPSPAAVCLEEESAAKTMEAAAIATAITDDPAPAAVAGTEDMLTKPAASGKFGADGVATPRKTRPSSTKTAFPELSLTSRRQKARRGSKASALKGSSAGGSRRYDRRLKTDEEDDIMAALSAAAVAHRVRTTKQQRNPRRRAGGVTDNVVMDAGVGEGMILSSSAPAVAKRVIDADTPVAEVKEAYDCSLRAPSHESEASHSVRKPAVRGAVIAMPLGEARSPMPAAAATPKRGDTAEVSVSLAAAASTLPRDTELEFETCTLSEDTYARSRVSTNGTASDFLDGATEHSYAAAGAAHASLLDTAAKGSKIGLEEPFARIGGRGPQAFVSTGSRDIGDGFGDNDSLTSAEREGFERFVKEEESVESLSEVETGVLPERGELMAVVSMKEAQPEPQPETRNLAAEDLGVGGCGGRYTTQTPPPFSREMQTPPPFSGEVQTPPPFSGEVQRPLPFSGEMQTPPPFHDEIFEAVDTFDRGDDFGDIGGPGCSSQASEETDEEGGEVTFPPSPPPGCSDNYSTSGEAEEEFYRIDPAGDGDAGGDLVEGSSPRSSLAPAAEEGGCVGTLARDDAFEPTAAVAGEGWGAGWHQQQSLAREAVRVERRAVGDVGGEHQAVAEAFGSSCIEGVRLVVEWLGSVESVVRAMAVSTAWRDAVRPDADRLYKVIVRRAGVTPRRRAAFWEYLVLRRPPRPRQQAGDSTDPLRSLCTSSPWSSPSSSPSTASRLSLTVLANRGMKSRWSKAIDADVARTFGRPNSRRQSFRMGAGQDIRQQHWWPESLGGAPLGARTPIHMGSSSTGNCNYGATNDEEAFHYSSAAGVEGCDDLEAAKVAAAAGAALAAAAFRCSRSKEPAADGSGGEGDKETAVGGTSFSTFSTVAISSSGNCSVGAPRSSSPLSCRAYSTLSPLGTPLRGQEEEQDYVNGGGVGGEGEEEECDGLEFVPSPRVLRELETVRGQLTDALRALAVAFSKVGYCQGLDYVVAHIIKCLGTDANRAYSSDPDRVFTVLIGLFEGYGLQHIYSEDLETLQIMLGVLDLLIEEHLPRLHRHFKQQEVDVAYFAVGWFQTLFLYTTRMPPDTLLWLWDVWVMERSYKVFFRAALAILALLESRLLALDLEAIMAHLGHFPNGSAAAMEKDALVPTALSFKVTDSILRDKQRQLDLSKKRDANSLGWTPRRPPETPPFPHASSISLCDDAFPTEEEGVTASASSASPVDAGTGSVEGDFAGFPDARQGGQLSSNCASDDGAEVLVCTKAVKVKARKARDVPSARGCRGTGGSYTAGTGAEGSCDVSDDGDQEFATMTRLTYFQRGVDVTASKCQGAKRAEQSPSSCGEKRGTRSPSDSRQSTTPTLPDHGPGKTAADPSGVTDFRVRFKPEAEPTTKPRGTLPLLPRSLAGVAASKGAPVQGTACKADAEVNAGKPGRRASGCSGSDQDSEGSLPPEMEPLARAGRAGGFVPSSRSQDWSLAKSHSSGSGAAGGNEGRSRSIRFDSAPAAAPLPPGVLPPGVLPPGILPPGILPPGVLPPGVQPPGVCPPGKEKKLGGKEEYALLAAGNE